MTLENLQKDMISAMKAKDKVRKDVISSLIAAVKKYGIDNGVRNDITEEMTNSVILKELKQAKELIDTCPQDRTELLEAFKTNYAIIEEYAPKLLNSDEVRAILVEKFSDVLKTKNRGMIMKEVMAELKGKADGKVISEVVGEFLK